MSHLVYEVWERFFDAVRSVDGGGPVGPEGGDGHRHHQAMVISAVDFDAFEFSAAYHHAVGPRFDARAHGRQHLGHRLDAVALLVAAHFGVGQHGFALGVGPDDGQQHELVDEVVAVDRHALQLAVAGDDAVVVDFDVGPHLLQDGDDFLIALAVREVHARHAEFAARRDDGCDDRVHGSRPVQRDRHLESRPAGLPANAVPLEVVVAVLHAAAVEPAEGHLHPRLFAGADGHDLAGRFGQGRGYQNRRDRLGVHRVDFRPAALELAANDDRRMAVALGAHAPRAEAVQCVHDGLAQPDVTQRMVAREHRVALAARAQGREESQDDAAVAAVDDVVGRLQVAGHAGDLPQVVGLGVDLSPEHLQGLDAPHPVVGDSRRRNATGALSQARHDERAERMALIRRYPHLTAQVLGWPNR